MGERHDAVADLVEQHHEDLERIHDGRVPSEPDRSEVEGEAGQEGEAAFGLGAHAG